MDELHELNAAINRLWQFIKQYNDKLDTDEHIDLVLNQADLVVTDNPAVTDLLQDWFVAWLKYKDRKGKKNG